MHKYKEPRTVCLLGATFATGNMGVNALTVGAMKCILQSWPDAHVVLLDYEERPTTYVVELSERRIEAALVNMRFSKKLWLPNHILVLIGLALLRRVIPWKAARNWLTSRNQWLSAIDGVDLAASVAGGDSFSDIYGLGRFFYVALPQLLCLAAGRRLMLMPQTLGPFRNPLVRVTARYILRRAEVVYSRDYPGVGYAKALIGRGRVAPPPRFCHDVGVLLDPSSIGVPSLGELGLKMDGRCIVGLNVSGLLSAGGGSFGRQAHFKTDYDSMILKLIEMLVRSNGAAVILIPHVFGKGHESDEAICELVYSELRDAFPGYLGLARGSYDQSQIKYLIGLCDFFIGSRMHACIAAVSQGVPAVSLAYSDKFIGVMETMGLSRLVADLRTQGENEILAVVNSAFDEREEHRARLIGEMPGLRKSVLNVFADIEIAAAQ